MINAALATLSSPTSVNLNELSSSPLLHDSEGNGFSYRSVRDALTKFVGIGQNAPDYTLALRFLNHELALGLGDYELNYLDTLMNGLSAIKRFAGDHHISQCFADNTAIHTLHCLPLGQEMFRRAGLLAPGKSTCSEPRLELLRLGVMGGFMFHDTGEFLVEPSSVASRSSIGTGIEGDGELSGSNKVSLELYVARVAHTIGFLAATAAQQNKFTELATLHEKSNQIRGDAIGHVSRGGAEAVNNALTSHFPHLISLLDTWDPLTDDQKDQVEKTIRLMQLIDAPEDFFEQSGIDPYSFEGTYLRFYRGCVKTGDSNQGNRFFKSKFATESQDARLNLFGEETNGNFLRFDSKLGFSVDTIPIAYTDSNRMLNNFRFSEKHIVPLIESAQQLLMFKDKGDFQPEYNLAKTIVRSIYLSIIEMSQHAPRFIERIQDEDTSHADMLTRHEEFIEGIRAGVYSNSDAVKIRRGIIEERKSYIDGLAQIWSDPQQNLTSNGPKVITHRELQALYLRALEQFWLGKIDDSHPISRGISIVDSLSNERYVEIKKEAETLDLSARSVQTGIRKKYESLFALDLELT